MAKKNDAKNDKSTTKKAIQKTAEKAIARAEKAVKAAKEASRDSTKKLRDRADALSRKTEKLAAKHEAAVRDLATEESIAANTVARATTTASGEISLTPPLPSPQAAPPTLAHLRQQARDQKIPGYSRMTKATLIETLRNSD